MTYVEVLKTASLYEVNERGTVLHETILFFNIPCDDRSIKHSSFKLEDIRFS